MTFYINDQYANIREIWCSISYLMLPTLCAIDNISIAYMYKYKNIKTNSEFQFNDKKDWLDLRNMLSQKILEN